MPLALFMSISGLVTYGHSCSLPALCFPRFSPSELPCGSESWWDLLLDVARTVVMEEGGVVKWTPSLPAPPQEHHLGCPHPGVLQVPSESQGCPRCFCIPGRYKIDR